MTFGATRDDESRWVPLHPLSDGGFRMVVEVGENGQARRVDSGDPSVSRYQLRVRSGTGLTVARGVLEIPDIAGYRSASENSLIRSQDDVETDWATRRKEMEELRDDLSGPRILLPEGAADRLPALVATEGGMSALPCPSCGTALGICRDGERLAQAGLGPPGQSFDVVLCCPRECAEEDTATRLFVAAEAPPAELADSGCLGLAALRELLVASDVITTLDPSQPWQVVTDRNLPFVVLETRGGKMDDLADYLGSSDTARSPGESLGKHLFGYQGAGLDAIEVFYLKLALFRQALAIVSGYHRCFGRPHLDLHPGHFGVDLGPSHGLGLPASWSFSTSLLTASSARPRTLGPGVRWIAPPAHPKAPYASPAIQRACLGTTATGRLVVDRLVEHSGRFRLEARLADRNGFFPRPGQDDWIRIRLRERSIGDVRVLFLRRDPRSFGESGSLSVASEPFDLDRATADRWLSLSQVDLGEVEYRIFPFLGFEEDLYSLGMMLLRLLLVNDEHDLGTVKSALEEDLHKAQRTWVESQVSYPEAMEELGHLATEMIADHPHVFGPQHIFFLQHDRDERRPNAIPRALWETTLVMALGWLIRCADRREEAEQIGPEALDEATVLVDDQLRRCRALLFRLQPVHLEVHSVVAEMLTALE